jgi:hypothetical protein
MKSYGLDGDFRTFELQPQFVLVYGRRAEFEERPEVRGIRAQQTGSDEYHVTFDRLVPEYNARNYFTLHKSGNDIQAVVVPPTVRFGPAIAPSWLRVRNREEAARAQERLSPERREFLASRFAYWDQWARREMRAYQTGDWE